MSKSKLHIKNAYIVDPYQEKEGTADIFVANGKIVACTYKGDKAPTFKANVTIEAGGKTVMPTLVDTNVHLREPGFERKATIESELKAAVSAGVGHLTAIPSCYPTIDTAAIAQSISDKAKVKSLAKVYPVGALTKGMDGQHLSEMKALTEAGCIALTNYYHAFEGMNVLIRCYEYAATFDIPVIIYPQMPSLFKEGGVHDGYWSAKLGLPAIPESAETIAIANHLLLIEQTGVKAHFSQISTAKAVQQIADAKQSGINISADVAAHQLFLDDSCLVGYDSNYHLCPPLRTKQDCEGLLKGLKDKTIDGLCSSHQPHEPAAKDLPFQASEPGISAMETLLPLAGRLEKLGFAKLEIARLLSRNPSNYLSIGQQGITENAPADFCMIDTDSEWQLLETDFLSAGKNSPFIGEHFSWRNHLTVIDGEIKFERS